MVEVSTPILDKDAWERVMVDRFSDALPVAKKFWSEVEKYNIYKTGTFPLPYANGTGMMVRITRVSNLSPIQGIQAFPFLPADELRISDVPGGYKKMVKKVCGNNMELDGMRIVVLDNQTNAYTMGTMIAFVPPERLKVRWERWMYISMDECWALARGEVPKAVRIRAKKMVNEVYKENKRWRENLYQNQKSQQE